MNIWIGVFVLLLVAMALGKYSDNVERRQADPQLHPLTNEPLDEYQRGECDRWSGWPENYRPWFCVK